MSKDAYETKNLLKSWTPASYNESILFDLINQVLVMKPLIVS